MSEYLDWMQRAQSGSLMLLLYNTREFEVIRKTFTKGVFEL